MVRSSGKMCLFSQNDDPNIVNKQHISATEKNEVSNNIVVGDFVKIFSGLFQGCYAVVLG